MHRHRCGLVWLRRDLRLQDHAALAAALKDCETVQPVFIFDTDILEALPSPQDRRVEFIQRTLADLHRQLTLMGGQLLVGHGRPTDLMPRLVESFNADAVYCAEDYEPSAIARDQRVGHDIAPRPMYLVKDQCIFAKREILTGSGQPYSVFTPYRNAWFKALTTHEYAEHSTNSLNDKLCQATLPLPQGWQTGPLTLEQLGFVATDLQKLPVQASSEGAHALVSDFLTRIGHYKQLRDYPGKKGVSYLSVHLRFGTISIRSLVRAALRTQATDPATEEGVQSWLNELIWRDFYMQILANNPGVVEHSFKPAYDAIQWDTGAEADQRFEAWCLGRTGYPIVDAAQRQLLQSGWMHNRLRMISASFLTKDLGIDWRRGEQWFARHLLDFDLSANNGGWQWAASTGCDAQPYFRIFNPEAQSRKFDADCQFIRRYVPEVRSWHNDRIHNPAGKSMTREIFTADDYPQPIVDHQSARLLTLQRYAIALG